VFAYTLSVLFERTTIRVAPVRRGPHLDCSPVLFRPCGHGLDREERCLAWKIGSGPLRLKLDAWERASSVHLDTLASKERSPAVRIIVDDGDEGPRRRRLIARRDPTGEALRRVVRCASLVDYDHLQLRRRGLRHAEGGW